MREFAYFGTHKNMKRLFSASVDAGMGAYVALVHPNDDNAFPVYSGDDENAIKQHAENLATRVGASVIQVTTKTKLEPENEHLADDSHETDFRDDLENEADAVASDHKDD